MSDDIHISRSIRDTPATPVVGTTTQPTCAVATGSVELSDLPTGNWTINPGNISGAGSTFTIAGLAVGTYTFSITNADGCISNASADVVILAQPNTPEVIIYSNTPCNKDDSVLLNVDLNSLLPLGTNITGTWSEESTPVSGGLFGSIFKPYGVVVNTYVLRYTYIDGFCTKMFDVNITVIDDCPISPASACEVDIHNAFSPNGDEYNPFFLIENLEETDCFPTNSVEVYNRWGVLVYETKQYNNADRSFKGISEGRVTIHQSAELPTGSYFYILKYTKKVTDANEVISYINDIKQGYLYLSR